MDVRSALGVDAERWNDLARRVHDWRLDLQERYAVPTDRELHACDLLAGRGKLARRDGADHRLAPQQGAEVFTGGLRVVEDAARSFGGVEVVNVCLRKPDVKGYEVVGSAWTASSTASTPPSPPRTATPSSSSTRAARR